jgi:hypothetical protein
MSSGNTTQEVIDRAIANQELGDDTAGFQTAEEATQGIGGDFQQVSQAGLRQRGATQAVETTTSEVEMSEITPVVEEATSALEIAGEGVVGAETAIAGGAAGVIAGAGAIAMGAVASVGALGYFVDKGLFDFNAQSNAFQQSGYNTAEEVATREPPKIRYVPPPPMFATTAQKMSYFQEQDAAQNDYNAEMNAYNEAIKAESQVPQVP